MSHARAKIYGLTGGIASGKSTVGSFFRDYGIPVIDADSIARSLRTPGGLAEPAIMARFGTMDSQKLRGIIAQDAAARKDLEAILHPLIRTASEREFQSWMTRGARYLVYEATFLIEAGRAAEFQGVILVESSEDLRLNRLIARDSMNEEHARRFIDAQSAALAPQRDREKVSTHRVFNDGSLAHLRESTRLLHCEFLAHALRER